eukprot:6213109-Pleurochrysis_carterae.AAC.1
MSSTLWEVTMFRTCRPNETRSKSPNGSRRLPAENRRTRRMREKLKTSGKAAVAAWRSSWSARIHARVETSRLWLLARAKKTARKESGVENGRMEKLANNGEGGSRFWRIISMPRRKGWGQEAERARERERVGESGRE